MKKRTAGFLTAAAIFMAALCFLPAACGKQEIEVPEVRVLPAAGRLQEMTEKVEEEIAAAEPEPVRGIYVTGPMAGHANMEELIRLVRDSELNAMVIDIKNDEGIVTYKMEEPMVQELGADVNYIPDLPGLLARLGREDVYRIARIVAFKDPLLASKRPDLCIQRKDGGVFVDGNGLAWVNPYRRAGIQLPDTFAINVANYCMPITGRITSDYGFRRYRMHRGVDIKLAIGDTIRAAFAGQVRFTNYERRGYGYYVVIRHPNGLETIYGHLSRFIAKEGDIVKVGDPIALGGNTGRSTGAHLHFEVRFLGLDLNPNEIFDFKANKIRNDIFVFRSAPYRAGTETYYSNGVTYSVYRVRKGDTLTSIARKYRTSINALCRLNKISPKRTLRIGQPIRID